MQGREGDLRVGQVADEDGRALAHGQDGVGLDLRVGRQDALGQPRDDGLGQIEVLVGGTRQLVIASSRASPGLDARNTFLDEEQEEGGGGGLPRY